MQSQPITIKEKVGLLKKKLKMLKKMQKKEGKVVNSKLVSRLANGQLILQADQSLRIVVPSSKSHLVEKANNFLNKKLLLMSKIEIQTINLKE